MDESMMNLSIHTTRFGDLEIEENRIINFPYGIIGFPAYKDYVIFEHRPDSPFYWLQSVSEPGLAFLLTNPFLVKSDYLEDLALDERHFFENEQGNEIVIYSLVTIPPGKVEKMTINLLGPLVIDTNTRVGKQVILANTGYNHQYPMIPQKD